MNSNEGLNFRIHLIGQANRVPCNLNPITLDKLINWIDKKEVEMPVKEELKRMAGKYPENALPNWVKNYNRHLLKAKKKVKSIEYPDFTGEKSEENNVE